MLSLTQRKKVNSMNVIAVIRKIAEIRLLKSQIKDYIELTCDMDALKLEDPTCNKRDKYICRKPGSQLPAFYRQLHDAQDSNLKRSLKHTEQAKNPWTSYLNVIYPMTRSQPKEKNLRVRPSSLRKRETFQPRVQVKPLNLGMRPKSDGDILKCTNHPSSKTHWT
jgi:hypothetical protein